MFSSLAQAAQCSGKIKNRLLGKAHVQKIERMAAGAGNRAEKGKKQLADDYDDGLEKHNLTTSALATKLLALWAHGQLSAKMVRELASLAVTDGATHQDLIQIAQVGSWGEHEGNCHKELMRRFVKGVAIADPVRVKVKCIDNKTSLEKVEEADVFLPHMVFSSLGENYPEFFEKSMNIQNLEKFWSAVEKSGDEKTKHHPMSEEQGWKAKNVPLFVHGDGVEFQSRDSLLTFSFGALGTALTSLETNLYIASFPKSSTHGETWTPIWKMLSWSFECLGKGTHPELDPDGRPLEKGSPWYEKRGQPLHPKGWKAQVWCITGDHEFFANQLKLGHWASHHPCWECDAQKGKTCALEKAYKQISLEKQKFRVWSVAEHMEDPASSHAIFQVPGISAANVRGDPLHILFCKGLYSHLIGSILHYCCFYEGPGQTCKIKPWERLATIFSEIQAEYSEMKTSCRLTNLRLSMFCDAQKPWKRFAELDCKGGEAKHLLGPLLAVLRRIFSMESAHEQKMVSAATSLEKLVALWDGAGIVLTPAEFSKSLTLGKGFLDDYAWLNQWSLEKDRKSFHITAKHHTFIHLLWNSKFLNPRLHMCFKSEDFVGQVSKVAHSISMGVASARISQKFAAKYKVLLHLLVSSERFKLCSKDLWEA